MATDSKQNEESIVKVLYKYVSAERALTCLPEVGDGTLRATQPSALNDPFECSVGKVFFMTRDSHDAILAESLSKINTATTIDEHEVKQAREKWGTLFWQELLRQQVSHRFGIVSLASKARHPLLWAHYTVDGSGFAIGYDIATLRTLTCGKERLKRVKYTKTRLPITGYEMLLYKDNIHKILLMKSEYWSYEMEWRIVVELNRTIETGKIDARGQPVNLFRIPNAGVKEIYYTERTPAEIVDKIKSRIRDANNRYGVRDVDKLVLSDTTYDYEKEARQ